jgi:protein SCO1/2
MFAVAAVLALLAGSNSAVADRALDAAALRDSQAAIGRHLGDLQLTDQFGHSFRLAELAGRPLVLSLVYTHCYDVCSGLTLHLRDVVRVARETLGAARFSVLTVGFDVDRDTPASMLAYGLDRGIDDPDWRFASGDAATIARLADSVGFTWTATPTGFQHITQVTVIDADGIVVQQVYGQDFPPPGLVDPLKSLVLERGFDRSTVSGVLDSVRLFCTAYDPVSGRYVFDYSMIIAAMPALLLLGMVAAAIIFAARSNR